MRGALSAKCGIYIFPLLMTVSYSGRSSDSGLSSHHIVIEQMKAATSYAQFRANAYCVSAHAQEFLTSPYPQLQSVFSIDQALRDMMLVSHEKLRWIKLVRRYEDKEYRYLNGIVHSGKARTYVNHSPEAAYQIFILSLHTASRHKDVPKLVSPVFDASGTEEYDEFMPMIDARSHGQGVTSGVGAAKQAPTVALPVRKSKECFAQSFAYYRAYYVHANPLFQKVLAKMAKKGDAISPPPSIEP